MKAVTLPAFQRGFSESNRSAAMVSEESHVESAGALPEDPLVGRSLNGRFHLLECIGLGGMGRVYKAIQEPLDRLVAVKVLSPSYATGRDPDFKRRFSLEASLTSKLRHPNTVTVIDYGQTGDGIYYIAMEYLEGKTLAEVLRSQGALPWPRALDIAQQVCRSLREAHKLGIIHRDLKPANIMLLDQDAEQDTVKVLDFGLVKSFLPEHDMDAAVTQAGVFLGSPQYMAPEQARNQVSTRSDVYSLGVVLFHMLMGRPPFQSKESLDLIIQHFNDPPPVFRALRPDLQIPNEVEDVVRSCLQKDPARRFPSMDELQRTLRRVLGHADPSGLFSGPRSYPPTPAGGLPPATPRPHVIDIGSATIADVSGPEISIEVVSGAHSGAHRQRIFGAVEHPKGSRFWRGVAFMGAVAVSFLIVLAIHREPGRSQAPQTQAPAAVTSLPAPAAPTAAIPTPPAAGAPVLVSGKAKVRFRVSTQPSGATVWLGNQRMGKTPVTFELPAGETGEATADLALTLDGYHPLLVTAGGYGPEVVFSQRLQRRSGSGPSIRAVAAPDAPPVHEAATVVASPVPAPKPSTQPSTPAVVSPKPLPSTSSPADGIAAALPSAPPSAPTPAVVSNTGEAVPFSEGMTPPELIDGIPPVYSREALAAHVEGVVVARCVVTTSGHLEKCRLIKSLPFMDQPILESLGTRRYNPAMYQGKPVAVEKVFTMRLATPHS
jgi:serine/threonine protein kinase